MRDCGATLAHCPTVFARRGIALQTLGDYLRHGVPVALGTDTYPHNMLEEIRTAALVARVTGGSVDDLCYADVFAAATVWRRGGARTRRHRAAGRRRARRTWSASTSRTRPCGRCASRCAACSRWRRERAVRDVHVDGVQVVADGRLSTLDLDAELAQLEAAQAKMTAAVPGRDWSGRTVGELAPMMLEGPSIRWADRPDRRGRCRVRTGRPLPCLTHRPGSSAKRCLRPPWCRSTPTRSVAKR